MKVSGMTYSLSFSPDGVHLAAGGRWCSAVWLVESENNLVTFQHGHFLRPVAFSPSGELLATAGDGIIHIWHIMKGLKICEFYDGEVRSVAFSPDGRILVSACLDGYTCLWTIPDKTKKKFKHGIESWSVAFSPDGRCFAVGRGMGYPLGFVVVRDLSKRTMIKWRFFASVESVSFSPCGKYLLVGSSDGFIRIFEWRHKKLVTEIHTNGRLWSASWFHSFPAWVSIYHGEYSAFEELPCKKHVSLALSRRGFLAIGHDSGFIEIIREGKVF